MPSVIEEIRYAISSKTAKMERLVIDGGRLARQRHDPPMYPGGNLIGAEEEQAVLEVLRSKRLPLSRPPTWPLQS